MGDDSREELRYHVDGEIVPASAATVSVEDRGFAYGDAAFETLRAYGGEVFRWGDHAARLADTCETLGLDHGLADADLKARIDETLAANDLADAYVKCSITRGVQPGTLDPRPEVDPTVVVIAKPLPRGGVDSEPVYDGPAALQTTKTRKPSPRALPADAKTHNYLNGILARLELRVTGADEALMLDQEGNVAEGATSNLFFVDGTALKTPSLDGPILPGVTRRAVIEIAEAEEIPVEEGTYAPDAVREADEVFLTNSTWEIRPVETVDGLDVSGDGEGAEGPLTALLSRVFDRRVEEGYYDGERL
ncbi:aminotransferase class IV [Halorubrum sp. CSM-61]|uniref:aminotransferase class IV n=1 Tax=Halorubrum sp. CSM-61 TaxID=2485838 RepID=UPI000F4B330C|nr:aminotransferase class IV [Halorubrum sp. CSM-61]